MRILDTTVFVDVLRGRSEVRQRFLDHRPHELAVPSIVRAELAVGAAIANDRWRERFGVDMMLAPLTTIDLDARIATGYGVLRAMLRTSGRELGVADAIVAATAISRDAVLVSSDARAFAGIPGLTVEDWRD